jgi:FkbM family methyltransferase
MHDKAEEQLGSIFNRIIERPEDHSCLSSRYSELKAAAKKHLIKLYGENSLQSALLPNIGVIHLPFFSMGNVDSVNLFDLDELILFAFYYLVKDRYKNALDIGANIGLHSTIMAKLGFKVTAFEPDPIHYEKLLANTILNGVNNSVIPVNAAVSKDSGVSEFTRVVGNTTGSHLTTAKVGAYGKLERFEVDVVSINSYASEIDFIKLDAEGEELNIIKGIDPELWSNIDIIAELGNQRNALLTLDYLESIDVKIYSQKNHWKRVSTPELMPTNYKEGSVFISRCHQMPWIN